jgi:hypothetical protein
MRLALLALPALLSGLCVVGAAQAQTRPLIFVADLAAPAHLTQDAAALTTSLCAMLARDPRIEVLCAPDVKQILDFAAMGALTGAPSPAVERLERRLAAVKFVVNGHLTSHEGGAAVVVAGGLRRADGGDFSLPILDSVSVRLEAAANGKSTRLSERLSDLSARLVTSLLAPATSATLPPEPLK